MLRRIGAVLSIITYCLVVSSLVAGGSSSASSTVRPVAFVHPTKPSFGLREGIIMSTSSSTEDNGSPKAPPASTSHEHDSSPKVPPAANALEFLRVVGKLKTLKRTGWVNHEVHLPESVSDHMYRMAMCSFLITDPSIDRSRLMKVAVIHDLAEAIIGDIVPHDTRYTKEQKRSLEEGAMRNIAKDIDHEGIGEELVSLWLEYEDGTSPEALIVKDFDKFEMIVQADEYERAQGKKLDGFFESTAGYFRHPQVIEWDTELRTQRSDRLKK